MRSKRYLRSAPLKSTLVCLSKADMHESEIVRAFAELLNYTESESGASQNFGEEASRRRQDRNQSDWTRVCMGHEACCLAGHPFSSTSWISYFLRDGDSKGKYMGKLAIFGERVLGRLPSANGEDKFHVGTWLGKTGRADFHTIATSDGLRWTRTIRRMPVPPEALSKVRTWPWNVSYGQIGTKATPLLTNWSDLCGGQGHLAGRSGNRFELEWKPPHKILNYVWMRFHWRRQGILFLKDLEENYPFFNRV